MPFNIFDIIGPVMIGPSSSHTAGAVRIGRVGWKILGEKAVKAEIGLFGSFAMTGKGHGTDRALVAGILGMTTDDERIPRSFEVAKEAGLDFTFSEVKLSQAHPNTAILQLTGVSGAQCIVQGASVGGGNIVITKLNGMESAFTGEQDTLIIAHKDMPGMIAMITAELAEHGINIGSFRLSRPQKGLQAVMTIELDTGIDEATVSKLRGLHDVGNVVYMAAH
ncbi:MAG: L-serine ammonia-lyase, iron-sulfur-dependent subunit beta [Spirochaetaceae bacterium]|nr:L-serine ammonia-lyase, iron-sulfur-dependent subunit beta [Spirochaetaceae bacterium]